MRVTMNTGTDKTSSTKKIRDQAFASPARVKTIIDAVSSAVNNVLPPTLEKMQLYIRTEKSLQLLLQPIKANIVEAYGQMIAIIESEYDTSERETLGLLSLDDLKSTLEHIFSST